MPLVKSDEKGYTKWYNNNYSDSYIAVLKFAKANNAVLFDSEKIHMQIGFRDIFVYIQEEEKTKISIVVKTKIFKSNRFIKRFYLEIGQFLKEVEE